MEGSLQSPNLESLQPVDFLPLPSLRFWRMGPAVVVGLRGLPHSEHCTGVGVGDVLGRDADNFVGTQATAHTEFHRNALNGVIKFVQQLLDLSF